MQASHVGLRLVKMRGMHLHAMAHKTGYRSTDG
jgi:hypothetical protein